jgi:hypothetical protein
MSVTAAAAAALACGFRVLFSELRAGSGRSQLGRR